MSIPEKERTEQLWAKGKQAFWEATGHSKQAGGVGKRGRYGPLQLYWTPLQFGVFFKGPNGPTGMFLVLSLCIPTGTSMTFMTKEA